MTDTQQATTFTPVPSVDRMNGTQLAVADSAPHAATAIGVPVATDGELPERIGVARERLAAAGFDGSIGSTLAVPSADGATVIAVGIGPSAALDANSLRNAAAAFARAAATHAALAFELGGTDAVTADRAAQSIVEGVLLARYRYDPLRRAPKGTAVASLTIVAAGGAVDAATEGVARGRAFAAAGQFSRDLANSPHSHLNATGLAELASELGPSRGLEVRVYDKDELIEMGCGGLLGVNAGSSEPPRMIRLDYTPATDRSKGHLGFVGKGLMYDSGGIAIKPGDEVHAQMKNDMSGAAAVLAAMLSLAELECGARVTAWLMCTDNMPSGTAMALGDVITMRGGTTVEVINTDAEGRLVMADALVLATEDGVDAIVDMATLTGACMRALGTKVAGVMGNDAHVIGQLEAAAAATDEPIWELPLDARYRHELDSTVADLRNLGGANAGAITAALFLAEFVGDTPWAHVDIAGTAQSTGDTGWQTAGCTGFGARLLLQYALDFEARTP
jgi:leucyl aminopeptidase